MHITMNWMLKNTEKSKSNIRHKIFQIIENEYSEHRTQVLEDKRVDPSEDCFIRR